MYNNYAIHIMYFIELYWSVRLFVHILLSHATFGNTKVLGKQHM